MRQRNPYPKRKNFGLRVLRARKLLERFGHDYCRPPYSRSFDNCFENYDGDAVVWALMHKALNGNHALERGIRNMGEQVWPAWLAVYTRHHRNDRQLSLSID